MKFLIITEKCSSNGAELDGGARLVKTLQQALGKSVKIMQFGQAADASADWHYQYPFDLPNRFERRIANRRFIAERIKTVESNFTHVIFIHVSMQFGITEIPLSNSIQLWTFPMFLTPSYEASGETVPDHYVALERVTLAAAQNILTPSQLEKRQLMEYYSVPEKRIHVVPRGVEMHLFSPKSRTDLRKPQFCSVGSIKPQKNTLGLIHLFSKILRWYPEAELRIIGPVQNLSYYESVRAEINHLGLANSIEMVGHVPHTSLPQMLEGFHIHLSAATCETFGRAIFETLALGLPNVARKSGNAAAEYLSDLPYAIFADQHEEALHGVKKILNNFPKLSSMAAEVGHFFDENYLRELLVAKLCDRMTMAISDFDGTLYHKENTDKTVQCIAAFNKFSKKILCSARRIEDLVDQMSTLGIEADWIVGCSGGIVADGAGNKIWHTPLDVQEVHELEASVPQFQRIKYEGDVLQLAVPTEYLPPVPTLRVEIYQGIAYVSHWEASKFRAVHRLLRHIGWQGSVAAFGDGPYDQELLTYFDGKCDGRILL